MVSDKSRKRLPPYVSYRTFFNFLDGLQQAIPARIDRSYWGDLYSGSNGIQLVSALRFLGLVDANGVPTNQLRDLVSARGIQRSEILKKVCSESFVFLLGNSFNPQQATYSQLEEVFHDLYDVNGDVSRKCIKFFIELAGEAGLPLSPFITKKSRGAHSGIASKKSSKKPPVRTNQNLKVPQVVEIVPGQTWKERLLEKFPSFDPAWPNDVQLKWFEAFDQLLKRGIAMDGDK